MKHSNSMSDQAFNVIDHDVEFLNYKDGIILSGTLSIPETPRKPAVVILIAGVGPYDRDCTQMGDHKLFLVMAQNFTQHGIAVLRYDKRGVGKSGGTYDTASTLDFAQDVLAAVQFLKQKSDVDIQHIGLVGHSEGGLISFIVASKSPDVAFLVSMAGVVISKIDDVLLQAELLFKACGAPNEFIAHDRIIRKQILETITTLSVEDAHKKLLPLVKAYVESMTDEQKTAANTLLPFALTEDNYEQWILIFNSAWRGILLSNPMNYIGKVTIPVLAIYGELDFIIPSTLALPIIEQGLKNAGNKDVTIRSIPHQNHCFQECKTGALSEYGTIHETIHKSTLKLITDWVLSTVGSIQVGRGKIL